MSLRDGGPRYPVTLASMPTAAASSGATFRVGGHFYFSDGTTIYQLDQSAKIRTVTASTAIAVDDRNLFVDSSSDLDVSIPDNATAAIPVGTRVTIGKLGTGRLQVSIMNGLVTLLGTPLIGGISAELRTKGSTATLLKVATNTWLISGDLGRDAYFEATSGDGSGATYATVSGNGFNLVPLQNLVEATGGFSMSSSIVTIPANGRYDVRASVRLYDNECSNVRSLGKGVATTQADYPKFAWENNSLLRYTSQWSTIQTWSSGDQVRLFIYSDGYDAPLSGAALSIHLVERL